MRVSDYSVSDLCVCVAEKDDQGGEMVSQGSGGKQRPSSASKASSSSNKSGKSAGVSLLLPPPRPPPLSLSLSRTRARSLYRSHLSHALGFGAIVDNS